MLGSVFRRRPSAALVVALIALFVALSGWGYAATSGTLALGQANKASRPTRLTSGAQHGPTLALKNTGGQAAATFSVKSGVAPFSVGSAARVARLNADLLDGVDSSGFYTAGSKVADADRLDGVDSKGFYAAGSKVADADKLDGLDSTAFQKRISKSCTAGSSIRVVNADGSVVCEQGHTDVITGYEYVRGDVATLDGTAGHFASSTVSCPSGKVALGGGWDHSSGDTLPIPSFVVDWDGQGGITSRWIVHMNVVNNTPTGGSYHFQAFAICAKT
jgi:hypothetical protein